MDSSKEKSHGGTSEKPNPYAWYLSAAANFSVVRIKYNEDLTNFFSFVNLAIGNLVFTQPIGQSLITNISWTDVVGGRPIQRWVLGQ